MKYQVFCIAKDGKSYESISCLYFSSFSEAVKCTNRLDEYSHSHDNKDREFYGAKWFAVIK